MRYDNDDDFAPGDDDDYEPPFRTSRAVSTAFTRALEPWEEAPTKVTRIEAVQPVAVAAQPVSNADLRSSSRQAVEASVVARESSRALRQRRLEASRVPAAPIERAVHPTEHAMWGMALGLLVSAVLVGIIFFILDAPFQTNVAGGW